MSLTYLSISFIHLMVSEKKIYQHFSKNFTFLPTWHPIKFSDLDKSLMKRRGLLDKHFCIKQSQILPLRQKKMSISAFPIISLWKLHCSKHLKEHTVFTRRHNGTHAMFKVRLSSTDNNRNLHLCYTSFIICGIFKLRSLE